MGHRLPQSIIDAVENAGVEFSYMTRGIAKMLDVKLKRGEASTFCGWYWQHVVKGHVIEVDQAGPFMTWSAAVNDAYVTLRLSNSANWKAIPRKNFHKEFKKKEYAKKVFG